MPRKVHVKFDVKMFILITGCRRRPLNATIRNFPLCENTNVSTHNDLNLHGVKITIAANYFKIRCSKYHGILTDIFVRLKVHQVVLFMMY